MAKINGKIGNLVKGKVDDNKRDQVVKVAQSAKKAGAPLLAKDSEPRVLTRLQLPESLKERLDLLFVKHKKSDELKHGKNEFLIAAVRSEIERVEKKLD